MAEFVLLSLHSKTGTLDAVEPYDFRRSLDFLQGFGPMSGEQSVEGGSATKAVMVEGQVVAMRLARAKKEATVDYELFSVEPISPKLADSMAERVSFFLSLKDDVQPFYSIAKDKDPKFYPIIERAWGLHQVKFPSLLEITCWALINQRIQRPVALRIKRALTERYGGSIEVDGKVYWAFPDRPRLEAATARELLEATRNQRIAQRLVSLISSLDELDEGFLATAPYEKAKERLEKVRGIGEWSSYFILFRGLGRMGRLQPMNVRPLVETIKTVYGPEGRPLEEINETYGSWAGYWSLYLRASTMAGFTSP
jgi:DNA-3-methyladenine glycosylase II